MPLLVISRRRVGTVDTAGDAWEKIYEGPSQYSGPVRDVDVLTLPDGGAVVLAGGVGTAFSFRVKGTNVTGPLFVPASSEGDFGASVCLSFSTSFSVVIAFVGAPGPLNGGSVHVFDSSAASAVSWKKLHTIEPASSATQFGRLVRANRNSGTIVAVGSENANAFLFRRRDGADAWDPLAPAVGFSLEPSSLSIAGLAVSASGFKVAVAAAGLVRLYCTDCVVEGPRTPELEITVAEDIEVASDVGPAVVDRGLPMHLDAAGELETLVVSFTNATVNLVAVYHRTSPTAPFFLAPLFVEGDSTAVALGSAKISLSWPTPPGQTRPSVAPLTALASSTRTSYGYSFCALSPTCELQLCQLGTAEGLGSPCLVRPVVLVPTLPPTLPPFVPSPAPTPAPPTFPTPSPTPVPCPAWASISTCCQFECIWCMERSRFELIDDFRFLERVNSGVCVKHCDAILGPAEITDPVNTCLALGTTAEPGAAPTAGTAAPTPMPWDAQFTPPPGAIDLTVLIPIVIVLVLLCISACAGLLVYCICQQRRRGTSAARPPSQRQMGSRRSRNRLQSRHSQTSMRMSGAGGGSKRRRTRTSSSHQQVYDMLPAHSSMTSASPQYDHLSIGSTTPTSPAAYDKLADPAPHYAPGPIVTKGKLTSEGEEADDTATATEYNLYSALQVKWTCECGNSNVDTPNCYACDRPRPVAKWQCTTCENVNGATLLMCAQCDAEKPRE